jgi:hypothetical protein
MVAGRSQGADANGSRSSTLSRGRSDQPPEGCHQKDATRGQAAERCSQKNTARRTPPMAKPQKEAARGKPPEEKREESEDGLVPRARQRNLERTLGKLSPRDTTAGTARSPAPGDRATGMCANADAAEGLPSHDDHWHQEIELPACTQNADAEEELPSHDDRRTPGPACPRRPTMRGTPRPRRSEAAIKARSRGQGFRKRPRAPTLILARRRRPGMLVTGRASSG